MGEGLTGPQLSEWGCWDRGRGGDFSFSQGEEWLYSHKNELISEIFNNKKSLKAKIFFSVILKNSTGKF